MQFWTFAVPSILAIASATAPSTALAEGRLTLGLGTKIGSSLYEDADNDLELFPFLSYENGPFRLGLDGLRYRIDATDQLKLSVGLAPRAEPDFPDTALFRGLTRDATAEALVSLEYRLGASAGLTFSAQTDILGEHDGTEVTAAFGIGDQFGPVTLDMQTGVMWRSAGLNDYLIGVSGAEATTQRAAYSPGATTSPFVGLSATLPVSSNAALVGNLSFEYLGDTYRDSPLVERRYSSSASLGFVVSF